MKRQMGMCWDIKTSETAEESKGVHFSDWYCTKHQHKKGVCSPLMWFMSHISFFYSLFSQFTMILFTPEPFQSFMRLLSRIWFEAPAPNVSHWPAASWRSLFTRRQFLLCSFSKMLPEKFCCSRLFYGVRPFFWSENC